MLGWSLRGAQVRTCPKQPRLDGAHGDVQLFGSFLAAQTFDSCKDEHLPVRLRQTIKCPRKVPDLELFWLRRRRAQLLSPVLDRHLHAPARYLPPVIAVHVVENGEQPSPQIGAGPELIEVRDRPLQAVLDEVVCFIGASCERASVAMQGWNLLGDNLAPAPGHDAFLTLSFCQDTPPHVPG